MSFEELSGVSEPPDDHPHDDHGALSRVTTTGYANSSNALGR